MDSIKKCEKCGAMCDEADTVMVGHYAPACVARLLRRLEAAEKIVNIAAALNCCDGDDARRSPEMQSALDEWVVLT